MLDIPLVGMSQCGILSVFNMQSLAKLRQSGYSAGSSLQDEGKSVGAEMRTTAHNTLPGALYGDIQWLRKSWAISSSR